MTSCDRSAARVLAILGMFAVGGAPPAWSQVTAGTLDGSVKDQTGQPLARATVRVADDRHGVARSAVTDDAGFYRIVDLPPSGYVVTASAVGFREAHNQLTVRVGSKSRVDFELPLATLAQTVDVPATVHPVLTTSGDLGMVLDRRRLEGLPLNRRDFLQLSLLAPGVEGPVESSELSSRGAVAIHANGGREEFNNFLLDGVDNNDPYVNRYVVQPSVDSVDEFKVATNSYSAEYGRNAGAQVNVVTRRGTSRVEGFGYEYFRNDVLDAPTYFEESGKQPLTRNQFGGGIGGPLVPDRTFLFGTIDLLRERRGLSRLGTVPGAAARSGDLSALGKPIVDPFTGVPFANGMVPQTRISPLARQVLALFPAANRSGATNYLGQPIGRDRNTQGTVRVDDRLSPADTLTIRYSAAIVHLFEPYTEGTGVTAGFGSLVDDRTWNTMAQHQHVSARAVNSLRFAANLFGRAASTENHQTNVGAAWGVSWLNVAPESFGYPIVDVAGYSRVGDAFSLPILRNTTTYQVADDLSLDRGNHLVKIGGEVRHIRLNSKVDLFSRGMISFTGAFSGSGIGDLLLGLPTFGIQAQADNPIRMRTNAYSTYVQDEWRALPNLTVNAGLRYEYVAPPTDANDGMTALNLATGQLAKVGTDGISRSGLSPDRNNLAPRASASWNVSRSTLVRGGYGVFYDSGMLTVNTAQYFNPPQFNLRVFVPGPQGLLSLANPFPLTSGFTPPPTLSTLSPDVVAAYLQHWNAAVQREVPSIGTVTVAYAGSKGSNLVRPRNLNQATPGPGDVQGRRPNPRFSDVFFVESEGRSRFDSLQVAFDRPLTRSVSLWAAYTLAKSNDDASAFLGTPADKNLPQDSRNPGAEWGPSSFDVRHRLALAYIIQLPQDNVVTRGMQIQGMTIVHSGQPFTPILRFDNSNTGNTGGSTAGSDRPNLVGDPDLSDPTADRWFNTAAFAVPARYTFGNAGRNSVRGPGFASVDVAVAKQLHAAGRSAVTVGLQAFNVFNRANFDLPEHFVDEPATFGRILSAKAGRELQLTARFAF